MVQSEVINGYNSAKGIVESGNMLLFRFYRLLPFLRGIGRTIG